MKKSLILFICLMLLISAIIMCGCTARDKADESFEVYRVKIVNDTETDEPIVLTADEKTGYVVQLKIDGDNYTLTYTAKEITIYPSGQIKAIVVDSSQTTTIYTSLNRASVFTYEYK